MTNATATAISLESPSPLFDGVPITYIPDFVLNPDNAFKRLWTELDWERRDGAPRREYYANDTPVAYTYGAGNGVRSYEPKPWHPVMLELRRTLEMMTGAVLDVCFLNGYETSKDALGWHADDSPEMDDARPIAIVSLGAVRDIYFKPQDGDLITKVRLGHGSLCLMHPGMQDTHFHKIPKADYDCGPRVSLTFRGFVDLRA